MLTKVTILKGKEKKICEHNSRTSSSYIHTEHSKSWKYTTAKGKDAKLRDPHLHTAGVQTHMQRKPEAASSGVSSSPAWSAHQTSE